MISIKVGGVPEHFNLPWHLCLESGDFQKNGLHVEWRDFPDGTGAMNKSLRNEEIDVAVILTEGIVKDITAGNPSKVVQVYVSSPLEWGIHVAANSPYKNLSDLNGTTAAISREGSGSQLMAFVNAKNQDWDQDQLSFEIVGDIDGAIEALQHKKAQYFMWEHFTTKPLVDKGIFRRLGDCPTPWPCFVVAVRDKFLKEHRNEVAKLLEIVNSRSAGFKDIPGIEKELSSRYGQKIVDIKEWLQKTTWSQNQLSKEELNKVQGTLADLNLIQKKLTASEILYKL